MKHLILSSFLVLSFNAFANDGLTIGNSFQVDKGGHVFRGREPKKLVTELADFGITDVIIFKNDVKGEVKEEIAALKDLKIKSHHIPFFWKDYPSLQVACEQMVEAVNVIQMVKSQGGKVFFHCTAGEDRTGALAGIYRMLEEHLATDKVFKTEMCARGYSDGDAKKPGMVTGAIQKELTPLFLAMAERIESGAWELGKLTKKSCSGIAIKPTTVKCKK